MATTLQPKQRCPDKGHTYRDILTGTRGMVQGHPSSQETKPPDPFVQGSLEDLTLFTQAQKRNLGKQSRSS